MSVYDPLASFREGQKLYQQRARQALPILVRQARAKKSITYEALAEEMGMPNPRNLNYPLGCVGDALDALAKEWEDEIPHIQALVVNKSTRQPGPGFDGFLEARDKRWTNNAERRAIIETFWAEITHYPYWDDVLAELNLRPLPAALGETLANAAAGRRGGEGEEHKALKELVCRHPNLVGLTVEPSKRETEFGLPSGDSIDVCFSTRRVIYAVEVKPNGALTEDVARGLFQCVKYSAVLQADAAFRNDTRAVTAVLALGGAFPTALIPLRNSLGIQVFDNLGAG
jgi:hypothetical protein